MLSYFLAWVSATRPSYGRPKLDFRDFILDFDLRNFASTPSADGDVLGVVGRLTGNLKVKRWKGDKEETNYHFETTKIKDNQSQTNVVERGGSVREPAASVCCRTNTSRSCGNVYAEIRLGLSI